MEYIKNKSGTIVLAFDEDNLFYRSQETDNDSELDESIYIEQLSAENGGALKLITILNLQEENGIISGFNYILNEIKNTNSKLAQRLIEHEESIALLSKRIIIFKSEGYGRTSSWDNILFLITNGKGFDLCSSKHANFSAREMIEYYGLTDSEYFETALANGEIIEAEITDIKTVKELQDSIVLLLEREELWNINKDDIDWATIVDVLLHNTATHKLGIELKSLITND